MHIAYFQIFNDVIRMKRLIVIIKILVFTSIGFGRPAGDFHNKPASELVGFEICADCLYNSQLMFQKTKTVLNDSDMINHLESTLNSFIKRKK